MITGDGFTDAEMPQFDEWAVKLREGLQKVEPFQSLARYINWHVARVASTDSGIDQCPDPRDPSHKRTFFGVEGGWNNSDCPGYMGLHHVPRLMWVAEQGCGWEHLEVALVIANCSTWGGHSWPAAKTAIVPGLPWALVGLAAHEVGHTISRLAEEYISCVEDEPRHGEHNLARLPEVSASVKRRLEIVSGRLLRWAPADTVWWKLLATRPGEVRSDDTFKWVHVLGDPVQPGKSVKPSMPAACPDDAIGAFWGCQNGVDRNELVNLVAAMCTLSATDVEAVIATMQATTGFQPNRPSIEPADSCDQSWDPRGAFFFRPSPTCCMRSPLPPRFCRVCEHLTRNAILERCGLAPCEPLPPPPACP
jgi:hypothetical protein